MIKMHYSDRESTIRKTVDVVMDIMDINPSALIQHRDMIFKDRKLLAAIIERRLDFVEELRAL